MLGNKVNALFKLAAIGLWALSAGVQASESMALQKRQVSPQIEVLSSEDQRLRIHTFFGVSNSHIIETANELRLIDAQMTFSAAQKVAEYMKGLGKPLVQVILSHNHPDHWFGAEQFQAKTPIATSESVAEDLAKGGARYLKILAKRLAGDMPSSVVVPDEVLPLGEQNWDGLDVVVEEYADHEAHHSLLIRIPSAKVMIGQDLFYNKMFLVASERKRNAHWVEILQQFQKQSDANTVVLTGHGKSASTDLFAQNIAYLQKLDTLLAEGKSKDEVRTALLTAYPDFGGKGMLEISLRNLFQGH